METLTDRFSSYFGGSVAQDAAKSIANGAEIEFQVQGPSGQVSETFTFTKKVGKNAVVPGPARDPQLLFTMNEQAASGILEFQSELIGEIGVHIAKMLFTSKMKTAAEPGERLEIHFKAGVLTLFSKGYFGVLTHGGAQFASFLASQGLNGIGAIKSVLSKRK